MSTDIGDTIAGELRATGMRGRLVQRVPPLLELGEQVAYIGLCTPAGSWWREVLDAHVCVATDRRLMLIHSKHLTSDLPPGHATDPFREVPYRDIRAVEPHLGLLESKLTLRLADESIRLTSLRRKGARAIVATIRQHTAR